MERRRVIGRVAPPVFRKVVYYTILANWHPSVTVIFTQKKSHGFRYEPG